MGLLNQGLENKVYQKLQGILEQYSEDKYVEVANKLVKDKQITISEAVQLSLILACYMSQTDFNNSRWSKLLNSSMTHYRNDRLIKRFYNYATNYKAGLSINGVNYLNCINSKYYIEYDDKEEYNIVLYFNDREQFIKAAKEIDYQYGYWNYSDKWWLL